MAKDLSRLNVCGVFCISLRNRGDRRELFEREFSGSGLNVEFLLVERDNESPQRGCFDSHVTCARLALERGYRRVLVFEDDATLEQVGRGQVARINAFLQRSNPELLFLGANLGKVWLTWTRGIARVRAKGSHAYILSAEGCHRLLSLAPYSGSAIDVVFSRSFKGYMAFPMLSQQQPNEISYSDMRADASPGQEIITDRSFWARNRREQYRQAFLNLGKTLFLRDF